MLDYVNKIKKLNVLIIGDTILDDYIFCQAEGMSREDPALVVNPFKKKRFKGSLRILEFTPPEFKNMKKGTYFINTARGPLVNYNDLLKYLKNLWNALWAKTTIDEELKSRYDEVVKELADVKEAAKNTVAQAKDVVDAAKGKKRRGRKSTNRRKTNNNSKK